LAEAKSTTLSSTLVMFAPYSNFLSGRGCNTHLQHRLVYPKAMKRAHRTPPSFYRVVPSRPRYHLADLLLAMPEKLPRVEGWDDMPAVGREIEPAPMSLRAVQAMLRFMRAQKRRRRGAGVDLRKLIEEGRA